MLTWRMPDWESTQLSGDVPFTPNLASIILTVDQSEPRSLAHLFKWRRPVPRLCLQWRLLNRNHLDPRTGQTSL